MPRVFISYRHVEPDATVARELAASLGDSGHDVFIDTKIPLGHEWGAFIEEHLGDADWLVAIVSAQAAASDMVVTEIAEAHRLNGERGRPRIIPVCLGEGFRPHYPLSAYLSRFQQGEWRGPADTPALIARVKEALAATSRPRRVASQRMAMIERVRGDWIKGVLERSLHQIARIELGLTIDQTAVARGLDVVVQRPDEEPLQVAAGTPMATIFDDHRGQLLILGAPGSGKTTMLLELARDLLARAERDEEHPIPVVFNLSSWAQQRLSLEEWMISELNLRSDTPKKLAREWVTREQILPLLDGLDEVADAHRDACVSAINEYRKEHGWVQLVVCSRKVEYEALSQRLALPGAVVIQPFTREQIERHLNAAGAALEGVSAAVRDNAWLWEVLDTPLMLSLVALTYRDRDGAPAGQGPQDVFGRYVDSMFRRRAKETRFDEADMRTWLQWLASSMVERGQTVFFLEDVVPEWFPGKRSMWATGLMVAIAILLSGFWMWIVAATVQWVHSDRDAWSQALFKSDTHAFVIFSTPLACLFAVIYGRRAGPVDAIRVKFPGWRRFATAGARGAAIGFLATWPLSFGACYFINPGGDFFAIVDESDYPWLATAYAVAAGMLLTVVFLVRSVLMPVMSGERRDPRALVRRSALSAATILCVATAMSIPIVWYSTLQSGDSPLIGFEFLSWGGLFVALDRGGYFIIRHYIARLVLWRRKWGPWHYVRFLDAATERIFLRKVGGGYIFVHRVLMEYLAGPTRGAWGAASAG